MDKLTDSAETESELDEDYGDFDANGCMLGEEE